MPRLRQLHLSALRFREVSAVYTAKVITVSDRSYRGEREDAGGPAVRALLRQAGYEVGAAEIVPDERERIEAALKKASDEEKIALIVTTGGTGFAPRDVTPEATMAVCEKLAPGIPEAMRAASLRITPRPASADGALSSTSPAVPRARAKIWKRF